MTRDVVGCEYDVAEARSLLRDYRAGLPRCANGALLKEELAKLNLRAYAIGLLLTPDSQLSERFHQTILESSMRYEQGGIYTNMREAENMQHWIDFLTLLANPTPDLLAACPTLRFHTLL